MSHWSHEEDWGDTLDVTDGDGVVCLSVHTRVEAGDLEEGEAVATFNLDPMRAREFAQWLVIYADAAEAARSDPDDSPSRPLSWSDGPPAVPAEPTSPEICKAMEILVCTSRRNITELGWYPPGKTMEDALRIYDAWSEWATAVLRARGDAARGPTERSPPA